MVTKPYSCELINSFIFEGCKNIANNWKCNIWAKQGECRRRPGWMNENCARACGVCGNEQNIRQGKSTDFEEMFLR